MRDLFWIVGDPRGGPVLDAVVSTPKTDVHVPHTGLWPCSGASNITIVFSPEPVPPWVLVLVWARATGGARGASTSVISVSERNEGEEHREATSRHTPPHSNFDEQGDGRDDGLRR